MKIMKQTSRRRLLVTTSLLALTLAVSPLKADFGGAGGLFGPAVAHAESCCFTGETLVTMADGSERPICDIRVGDWVLNRAGGVNRVSGVEIVPLAGRMLHGVNSAAPFFTAEHPFLTPAGWKALDPVATALDTPRLRVTTLQVGDLLQRLRVQPATTLGATALAVAVVIEHERVLSFGCIAAPEETVVYNLLLDGDHSYVANGYIVHNKGDGGSGGGGGGTSASASTGTRGHGGRGRSRSEDDSRNGSDNSFLGSAEPAGPDLTHDQERDLISRGWK